jgi:type IV secretion system T-DNA border endonuclease VirD2
MADECREWRAGFARHLRLLGVAANATPRHVRGITRFQKPDGIYRARLRGESTHVLTRVNAVARELARGKLQFELGKAKLLRTRQEVRHGWEAVRHELDREGHGEMAAQVKQFVEQMPKPLTDKEYIATKLLIRTRQTRFSEIEMKRTR